MELKRLKLSNYEPPNGGSSFLKIIVKQVGKAKHLPRFKHFTNRTNQNINQLKSLEILDKESNKIENLGYLAKGEFGISGRRHFQKWWRLLLETADQKQMPDKPNPSISP